MNPSTASIWLLHENPRFDRTVSMIVFTFPEMALADIQNRAWEILEAGKIPLLLGGEHLVTLAAVRATARKYPGLHIIHFDAHADLRDDYLGARFMIFWEMDGSISFASEVGKEKNSGLQRSIQIFIPLPLKAWKRPYRSWTGSRFRYILPLIWIAWIHPYFRELVHRRREA